MSNENMPDFQELLQTAQQVQEQIKKVQEDLGKRRVEGASGGGMVVAVANGRQQLVSVTIDKEAVDPDDIPMLQDLVVSAVNQALAKSQELAQQEMQNAAGPMNLRIPGLT